MTVCAKVPIFIIVQGTEKYIEYSKSRKNVPGAKNKIEKIDINTGEKIFKSEMG